MVTVRKFGAGRSIRRAEDRRLLTGAGRFMDDVNRAYLAHGFVLRSPHAHARIVSIDTEAAQAAPGVLLVLTGADVVAEGLGALPCLAPVANRDGTRCHIGGWTLLAAEKARYAGDGVAFVVAETPAQARDAAELIDIGYEVMAPVVDTGSATAAKDQVWDDCPSNLCCDWAYGETAKADAAFADAAHVTTLDLINNRVVVASMETRGALAEYAPGEQRWTLHVGSQGVHGMRRGLAGVFGIGLNQLRVVTPEVGGGFGMKAVPYPEYALVMWAAKTLRRPVKWIGERSDAFLSDTHGRDHVTHAELALDEVSRMLAIRMHVTANMGAYISAFAPTIPTEPGILMAAAVYSIPAVDLSCKLVYTNTTPVEAYRGAGRPEAAYVVERLVDKAARETGLDPTELRRRNFIPPEAFPHRTVTGLTYDSGEYARNLDHALGHAGWARRAARKAEARARGKLLGMGMAYYIEICGTGAPEAARLKFDSSGELTVLVGVGPSGQGHETAFAQIASDWLGVPFDRIRVITGDTDANDYGHGTGGSRSLQTAGAALGLAAEKIVEKGRRIAAHMMEAAEVDVSFDDGRFAISGTDRSVAIEEVVRRAFQPAALPSGLEPGMDELGYFKQDAFTFPNGCHIAEVEVDPETGLIEVLRYLLVDDFGTVMNPLLVAGQVHGGVAQGLGQALLESAAYDADGQLLTGSFMDYCLPRAGDLPGIEFHYNEVPSPANPLGVKGCGEAGCVGGPPALVNAVLDALSEYGIDHIDMPITPQAVWRAIQVATRAGAA